MKKVNNIKDLREALNNREFPFETSNRKLIAIIMAMENFKNEGFKSLSLKTVQGYF